MFMEFPLLFTPFLRLIFLSFNLFSLFERRNIVWFLLDVARLPSNQRKYDGCKHYFDWLKQQHWLEERSYHGNNPFRRRFLSPHDAVEQGEEYGSSRSKITESVRNVNEPVRKLAFGRLFLLAFGSRFIFGATWLGIFLLLGPKIAKYLNNNHIDGDNYDTAL